MCQLIPVFRPCSCKKSSFDRVHWAYQEMLATTLAVKCLMVSLLRTSIAQVAMAPGVVWVKPQSLNIVSAHVPIKGCPSAIRTTAPGPWIRATKSCVKLHIRTIQKESKFHCDAPSSAQDSEKPDWCQMNLGNLCVRYWLPKFCNQCSHFVSWPSQFSPETSRISLEASANLRPTNQRWMALLVCGYVSMCWIAESSWHFETNPWLENVDAHS